jgi:serine/threonine protein phosphatase 1
LLAALAPRADDTLVFLGDLVDRGPGTRQVLDQLLELRRACRVVVIQGNHEEIMLRALSGEGWGAWLAFGGKEALESYGGRTSEIPPAHIELLERAMDYRESPSEIFVHANLEPGVPLAAQDPIWLRWTHLTGSESWYDPSRRVVCGHTPQKNGLPRVLPGWVCLDTDCQRGGWLSALDVGEDWVWQANEGGETRDFALGRTP